MRLVAWQSQLMRLDRPDDGWGHLPQEASVARSRPQVWSGLGRVRQASLHRPTRGARRRRGSHAVLAPTKSPSGSGRQRPAQGRRDGTADSSGGGWRPPRPRPVLLTATGIGVSFDARRRPETRPLRPLAATKLRAGQPTAGAAPACSDSRQPGRWLVTGGRGQERPVVGIGGCSTRRNRREPGPWNVGTQGRSEMAWTTSGRHDAGLAKQFTTRPVACCQPATSRLVGRYSRPAGRSRGKPAEIQGRSEFQVSTRAGFVLRAAGGPILRRGTAPPDLPLGKRSLVG